MWFLSPRPEPTIICIPSTPMMIACYLLYLHVHNMYLCTIVYLNMYIIYFILHCEYCDGACIALLLNALEIYSSSCMRWFCVVYWPQIGTGYQQCRFVWWLAELVCFCSLRHLFIRDIFIINLVEHVLIDKDFSFLRLPDELRNRQIFLQIK